MFNQATPPRRALVIDDDETMVEQLSGVLRKIGFAVEQSSDGLDALHRCQNADFDLVVCDVRMPRLSGTSFLNNLSRTPHRIGKIIMISALDDPAVKRQCLAAGATAYLVKPISAQTLRDVVGEAPVAR